MTRMENLLSLTQLAIVSPSWFTLFKALAETTRLMGTVNALTSLFIFVLPFVDGHNEAEFGMSWCAGFGSSFYNSYFEVFWCLNPPLAFFLSWALRQ